MKHEKYSFGYDLLRFYVRLMNRLVHRRITIAGLKNIPRNKPVIFAPNHQNALMDAMAVLLAVPHQLTWLSRADLFKNKLVSRILFFLKMSPVYRIRDGKDSLEKNDEVFELAIRILKTNKALGIFPEGMHTFKRQSAAHKKAVPRIAFMAEARENFELGIQVIPVGLFYDHYYKFNRQMMVSFGKPVLLKDYHELYNTNPGAATIALRKEIYAKLIPLTIHIKSKIHYEDYESLREIFRNNAPVKLSPSRQLANENYFIGTVENWGKQHSEEADKLFVLATTYRELLKKAKLTDRVFAGKISFAATIFKTFLAGLTLPVFLYGWLNFFLSFHLPSILIRKNITDRVFWATVEFVAWIIFIPLFSLIQWGMVWLITGDFAFAMLYLLTLPVFGWLALNINDFYGRLYQQIRVLVSQRAFHQIKSFRQNILELLNTIGSFKSEPLS